jgi:predicted O-methyltransferase YrrM
MRKLYGLLLKFKKYILMPKKVAIINNDIFQASNSSDISEHLSLIYSILLSRKPETILELGTRGGESTRVFIRYCDKFLKSGTSIDLSPAPDWMTSKNWTHFIGDDIEIGNNLKELKVWPNGVKFSEIDLIFIDSSHEYLHTMEELKLYFHMLSRNGVLILHDTNLTNRITRKIDGTPNIGWDNQSGVNRALEDFFNFKIDWNNLRSFETKNLLGDLSIIHYPWNNGLTLVFKN